MLLGLLVAAEQGRAQTPPPGGGAPGEDVLELSIGVGTTDLGSPWDRYWRAGPFLSGGIAAPLGWGWLRIGGEVGAARSDVVGVPSWWALAPSLEWGPRGGWGPVRLSAAAGIGAVVQVIDRPENRMETEMTAGLGVSAGLPLADGWVLALRGDLRRAFLAEPLDRASLAVELRRRIGGPVGLARALRGEAVPEPGGAGEVRPIDSSSQGPGGAVARVSGPRVRPGPGVEPEGWSNLSDAPSRLPGWVVETEDLRRHRWSVEGLSLPSESGTAGAVFLDGHPVPLGGLGTVALERLGFSRGGIDTVATLASPGLHQGHVGARGDLRLTTTVPAPGFRVAADVWLAQPPGDGGPLSETPLGSPNVDRLGQGFTAEVSGGGRAVRWDAAFLSSRTFTGYGDRGRRLSAVHPGQPLVDQEAGRASVAWIGGSSVHRLQGVVSRRDDLLPLPELAIDLPVTSDLAWIAASGGWRAAGGRVGYSAGWSRDEHSPGPSTLDYGVRLRRSGQDAAVWWEGGGWSVGTGGRRAAERGSGVDAAHTQLRVFGGGSVGRDSWRLAAEGEGAWVAGAIRWQGAARVRVGLGAGGWLAVSATHLERRPGEWTDVWALADRGWDLPEARGMAPLLPDTLPRVLERDELRGELGWAWGPVTLTLDGTLRDVRGILLARPRFEPGAPLPVPVTPTAVEADRGRVAGVGVSAVLTQAGRWSGGAGWRAGRFLSGGPAFAEAWATVPRRHGRAWIAWAGPAALTLHLRADHRGRTHWAAYPVGERPAELASVTEVEVGARKSFWERRVELAVSLRDLLDQGRPVHPLGAVPGRSVDVRLTLASGGGGR